MFLVSQLKSTKVKKKVEKFMPFSVIVEQFFILFDSGKASSLHSKIIISLKNINYFYIILTNEIHSHYGCGFHHQVVWR